MSVRSARAANEDRRPRCFAVYDSFGRTEPERESTTLDGVVSARKRVKRGDTLFRAGDPFTALYTIRAGFFKSRISLESGRDQVVGFQMSGELLGMDGIGTNVHTADAIALEDGEVGIIPYARIEGAEFHGSLRRAMGRELMREQGVMMLLGSMLAEERLAAFLLNLSQRLLSRGYSSREFHLRMSREEIGSYLGLSLETVSRLFSRFQAERLIDVRNKHVTIRDLDALRAVLRCERD
jgi:CRP/FNR family transcriptional regulator